MPGKNLPPPTEQVKPTRKPQTLEQIIKRAVLRELRRQQGNLSATARALGIARQTLLSYLDGWKLKVNDGGRTVRVLPWEKRWYEAREHTAGYNPRRGWRDPGMQELARRDMASLQHGNSDELARDAADAYGEALSRA